MIITKENWEESAQAILAGSAVHQITKDTLRAALTKDALDAYYDVQLVADVLKARLDALVG